jgi:shikimate kinase
MMVCKKYNLVLIGMPGCGKSTIGKKLANIINCTFIDVDELIEEISGKSIPEIFQQGEDNFRDIESSIIQDLENKTSAIISTGGGVIKRENNMTSLKRNGIIIFINRHPDNIIKDIDVASRPLLSNKKETLMKLYNERLELYKKYCDVEIINDSTIEETLAKVTLLCKEMDLL